MTFPVLSVRVAFASNPYDASLTFTEVGPASGLGPGGKGWVRSIKSKRGRERLLRSAAQFQAGTLVCALDNRDRRFDPTNTSSPYYPNVLPEKVVQIGATWSSVFYPIWTGYVDDWPQNWPGFSEAEVPLAATDYFKSLAVYRLISGGYPKQILADGAIAYWRLGDTPGSTIAIDSSGNGHNGTPDSSVTFGQAGALVANPGTSAQINESQAAGSWMGIWIPPIFGSKSAVTVSGWYNSSISGSDFNILFTVTMPAAGLPLNFSFNANTAVGLQLVISGGSSISQAATVSDGNWHFMAVTITSGGSLSFTATATFYLDGVAILTSAIGTGTGGSVFNHVGNGDGIFSQSGPSTSFDVQDVAFFPTALSGAAIANEFNLASFPPEKTGTRVNRILNVLGFPAGRRTVDTGRTLCGTDTTSEVNTKALDYLQKLEQTEQGQCYIRADGNLVFQDRYHRYESPNANVQATFGDGGGAFPSEIPYPVGGVTLNFDRMELFTDIPVTRRGGNLQEAVNAAAVTSYGDRIMPGLSDLLMATDADALYCAQWILADTAQPQFRVGDLILNPHLDDRLWPLVLGLDIGAVITVNKHNIPGGGTLSLTCRIEGIEHQVDPPYEWLTTWHVSLVGTNPWFILDDPVMGLLDHGNRLGW